MGTIPIPSIDTGVGGKYRYFHQVSLVFDTDPALFMVSCMYENLKKMSVKAKKKQKNAIFFLEVSLIELD